MSENGINTSKNKLQCIETYTDNYNIASEHKLYNLASFPGCGLGMRLCVDRPGGSKTLYIGFTDGDRREAAMNSCLQLLEEMVQKQLWHLGC